MSDLSIEWLRGLAEKGGKGVVNNIDARSLGRIADELEEWRQAASVEAGLRREYVDKTETLVRAMVDIKAATLNGSVCNDVAWFGPGETLHDFCESVLDRVGTPLTPGETS